jgi:hypothetical protein
LNRRRSRRFLTGNRGPPPPNLPPPAVLQPSRPHRRVLGEFSVQPDPSPCLAARRPCPVAAGTWEQLRLVLCPADLASVGWFVGLGPHPSAALGKKILGAKSSAHSFYFQKKCCKCLNFLKCIEYCLYVKKNANDLSKCSEK